MGRSEAIWPSEVYCAVTEGPLAVCDLKESKDKPVTPVASMLPKTATSNVLLTNCEEELWNAAFEKVTKAQVINHRSKITIPGEGGAEREHVHTATSPKVTREEYRELGISAMRG